MQAIPISLAEYQQFLTKRNLRHFYNHAPAYATLKKQEGSPVTLLALRDADQTVGVAQLIDYRYKRVLWRSECQFGPILDPCTPQTLGEAAIALKDFAFARVRCRAFRLTPMAILASAPEVSKEDFPSLPLSQEQKQQELAYREALSQAGFTPEPTQWYNHPFTLMRFCYSKPLPTDLPVQEAEASFWAAVSPTLRTAVNKSLKDGLSVRPLRRDELPLLTDMMQATYDRKQTLAIVTPERYRGLWNCFGSDLTYLLAYLDSPAVLKRLNEQKKALETEHEALETKYGSEPTSKKGRGALRDWQERYDPLLRQIQRIEQLQSQYGDEIPLNISGYIRCGKEWIHFLGAGYGDRQFLNGSSRLHLEAVHLALEAGCTLYNLYACSGLPPEHNRVDPGVQKYKEQFRGKYEMLLGGFFASKRFAFDYPARPLAQMESGSAPNPEAVHSGSTTTPIAKEEQS